jgi:hypothetical protein
MPKWNPFSKPTCKRWGCCDVNLPVARGIIDPKRGVEAVATDESRIKALARMYLERRT